MRLKCLLVFLLIVPEIIESNSPLTQHTFTNTLGWRQTVEVYRLKDTTKHRNLPSSHITMPKTHLFSSNGKKQKRQSKRERHGLNYKRTKRSYFQKEQTNHAFNDFFLDKKYHNTSRHSFRKHRHHHGRSSNFSSHLYHFSIMPPSHQHHPQHQNHQHQHHQYQNQHHQHQHQHQKHHQQHSTISSHHRHFFSTFFSHHSSLYHHQSTPSLYFSSHHSRHDHNHHHLQHPSSSHNLQNQSFSNRFSSSLVHQRYARRKHTNKNRKAYKQKEKEENSEDLFQNYDERKSPLPYGHHARKQGLLDHTACDWLVLVEECVGTCQVVSPMAPLSQNCSFFFVSSHLSRVKVTLPSSVKLITKRRDCEVVLWVSDGLEPMQYFQHEFCIAFLPQNHYDHYNNEEFSKLYDDLTYINNENNDTKKNNNENNSNDVELYRRFSGVFISKTSTLVMKFVPRSASLKPSVPYELFLFQAVERWKYITENGEKEKNTECDWSFRSSQTLSGDLHTPDYYLAGKTTCVYKFVCDKSRDVQRFQIEVQLNLFYSFGNESCHERIVLNDGLEHIATFCIFQDIYEVNQRFHYSHKAASHSVTVVYHRDEKQFSNTEPTWINYKFRRKKMTGENSLKNYTSVASINDSTPIFVTTLRNDSTSTLFNSINLLFFTLLSALTIIILAS